MALAYTGRDACFRECSFYFIMDIGGDASEEDRILVFE
jgi:hypothetical protein